MAEILTEQDVKRMLLDLRVPRAGEIYRDFQRSEYYIAGVRHGYVEGSRGTQHRSGIITYDPYSCEVGAWAQCIAIGYVRYARKA